MPEYFFLLDKTNNYGNSNFNHKVADYTTWKKGYDSDSTRRQSNGMTEIAVGRKSDDPSMAYIIMDVKDVAAMQKMFSDPQLQEAMKAAGVMGAPEMVIIEN